MTPADNPNPRFLRSEHFVEHGTFDQHLQQLTEATAEMLDSEICSVMLLEETGDSGPQLHLSAVTGPMPPQAFREVVGEKKGIAGHVMATGVALWIEDIHKSPFAHCARRSDDARRSLLCAPVRLHDRLVGVVNVSGRKTAGAFGASELKLLEAMALFIGKSIQVSQLQSMLNSRFAQMAVIQDAARGIEATLSEGLPNPDQVAKIMAKSFFKEMTRAGFGSRQIINAASEIIAQLTGNLQRHSKRLGPGTRTDVAPLINRTD